MACTAPTSGRQFLSSTLDYIDCQAQSIGSFGYLSLADPGSPVSALITSLLTIAIAVLGFRLLLGQRLGIGTGGTTIVYIGIALVLATSWPAVRTVLYDTVFRGPAELADLVTGSSGLVGQGLTPRLQGVDSAIQALTNIGTGRTELPPAVVATPPPAIADDLAFGLGRAAFLATAIGGATFTRLIAGVLLALAPFFAGLLLFQASRGIFAGWLRGLVAAALGAVVLAILLAVELALLEPWLADALARRAARLPTLAAPVELLVVTVGFAVALAGMLALMAKIVFMISFPDAGQPRDEQGGRFSERPLPAVNVERGLANNLYNTRATSIADAVSIVQRRESSGGASGSAMTGRTAQREATLFAPSGGVGSLRQSRRTQMRISSGSRKRDART